MFYAKCILLIFWLIITSFLGTIYSLFHWGNVDLDRAFARAFSWGALKILGLRVELEGAEYLRSDQPCIFVANHQGSADMITFGGSFPRRTVVIGKKEIRWIPFFGLFFWAAGNITIDRKKNAQAVAGLNQAVERIRKEQVSVWIFPEGTRNRTGQGLLPFKRGAFHMAIQAGIPIVPLVGEPLHHFISWKERRFKGGIYRIRVLPPVETGSSNTGQVDFLLNHVRQQMLEALHGLTLSEQDARSKLPTSPSSLNPIRNPNR